MEHRNSISNKVLTPRRVWCWMYTDVQVCSVSQDRLWWNAPKLANLQSYLSTDWNPWDQWFKAVKNLWAISTAHTYIHKRQHVQAYYIRKAFRKQVWLSCSVILNIATSLTSTLKLPHRRSGPHSANMAISHSHSHCTAVWGPSLTGCVTCWFSLRRPCLQVRACTKKKRFSGKRCCNIHIDIIPATLHKLTRSAAVSMFGGNIHRHRVMTMDWLWNHGPLGLDV